MKRIFKIVGIVPAVLLIALIVWMFFNLRDRHSGYSVDLKVANSPQKQLQAGFAAVAITLEVPDRWEDKNGDAKYNSKDGDSFTDGNGNGVFDPVWIAGFNNSKPANGIHDDTWARTMIIDDGTTCLAMVMIDAIGFMHDDVVDVREMIPEEAGVTYAIVASTHTHESADLLGMWGETPFKSGINKDYMKFVKNQIVRSIVEAADNLRPASLEISQDLTGAVQLVKDTRKPEVFDSGLRMIKAIDKENGNTLGSVVAWGNHPETLWSKNLLISSDFPHFVREGVERGVFNGDSLVTPGIGGVCVYMNGAIGGLMCTHPSLAVKDPFTGEEIKEPSFEKAAAEGKHLSMLALNAMDQPDTVIDTANISLMVRTVLFPINNNLFKLATALGVLDRGTTGWMKMRSEISVFKIGPLSFVTIPGEVYPEIVNGGVEAPEGNDLGIDAQEVPPIRDMMEGEFKFILGLANDEIGYIVPKSQWDVEAPYTYGRDNSPYGEENSLGKETAPLLHKNIQEMLNELKRM